MKILPDEIPAETAALANHEYVPAPLVCSESALRKMEGANVFVSLKGNKTLTGLLHSINSYSFIVGQDSERCYFSDVESFREV